MNEAPEKVNKFLVFVDVASAFEIVVDRSTRMIKQMVCEFVAECLLNFAVTGLVKITLRKDVNFVKLVIGRTTPTTILL